jgi:selenocysteine lyase/cysteine desulfurase
MAPPVRSTLADTHARDRARFDHREQRVEHAVLGRDPVPEQRSVVHFRSFRIDGVPAGQAAQALGQAGVNVSTTAPEHNPLDTQDRGVHPLIRFSPHYYNTEEEIDRTTELVAALTR